MHWEFPAPGGLPMNATALVLLMTLPGIALFYAGMLRRKSVLNVMACVVVICAGVSLLLVVGRLFTGLHT